MSEKRSGKEMGVNVKNVVRLQIWNSIILSLSVKAGVIQPIISNYSVESATGANMRKLNE
jgi:hypothetical protein